MNEAEWQQIFRVKGLIWATVIVVGTTASVTAIGVTLFLGLAEKSYVNALATCVGYGFAPHDLDELRPRIVYGNLESNPATPDFRLAESAVGKNASRPMTSLEMTDEMVSSNIEVYQLVSRIALNKCWNEVKSKS